MNVFSKVTLQSLRKNKTRTAVTIIGIMLSAAMICASATFINSVLHFGQRYAIYQSGDWHGAVYGATMDNYEEIKASGRISDASYAAELGYADIDGTNPYKPYIYVLGGGRETNIFEALPVHLILGEMPKNSGQIILPSQYAAEGDRIYKPGDTITLDIGKRTLYGQRVGQDVPCFEYSAEADGVVFNEEVIEAPVSKTYTVVGIYENSFDSRYAPGYTALTVCDADDGQTAPVSIWFKMKRPGDVYDFMKEIGKGQNLSKAVNNALLMYFGVTAIGDIQRMIYGLAAVVIALIMLGSISLIYNAFSISVAERTRQFGLLSSVGATKKQIGKMVLFEALAVSSVGIPLGILVGVGGMWVTLHFMGNKFTSLLGRIEIPMQFKVSRMSILVGLAISLVTILISAYIPAMRATRVSAVEAIRLNRDIKVKEKRERTSKFTYKLFGLPGVIAKKHYKRNRKKYRATVVSLALSIVLFVSAAGFTNYLTQSARAVANTDEFDLSYKASEEVMKKNTPEKLLGIFKSDKDVTNAAYIMTGTFKGMMPVEYATDDYLRDPDNIEGGAVAVSGQLCFIDDAQFKRLLAEYGFEEGDYYNRESPIGIALDDSVNYDSEKNKYVTTDVLKGGKSEIQFSTMRKIEGYDYWEEITDENGNRSVRYRKYRDESDFLDLTYEEALARSVLRTEKAITDAPFYMPSSQDVVLRIIYPLSMLKHVLPNEPQLYAEHRFYLMSGNHSASYENLSNLLTVNGIAANALFDLAADEEIERNTIAIIEVFSYGFIALISLIAVANVFNTITTNINLRRREFAMLKSVGMTQKSFGRMINFECVLYGSRAIMFGLPISVHAVFLIYRAVMYEMGMAFRLPWAAMGIAVLSVFLVVFVTMLYSANKLKRENPIEALKNENL